MASTRRKAAAAGLAVIGIAGLSLAAASTLSLTGSTLQAGTVDLTDCQTGDVAVEFAPAAFSAGVYRSAGVTLSGIDTDCDGKNLSVTVLLTSGQTDLGSVTIDDTSEAFTFAAAIDAKTLEGVAAVIAD